MLHRIARFLRENQAKLVREVPALKEVIDEFLKIEEGINKGQTTNLKWKVGVSALEKKSKICFPCNKVVLPSGSFDLYQYPSFAHY